MRCRDPPQVRSVDRVPRAGAATYFSTNGSHVEWVRVELSVQSFPNVRR